MTTELTNEQERINKLAISLRTAVEHLIDTTDGATSAAQNMNRASGLLTSAKEDFSQAVRGLTAHIADQLPSAVASRLSTVVSEAVTDSMKDTLDHLRNTTAEAQKAACLLKETLSTERLHLILYAVGGAVIAGGVAGGLMFMLLAHTSQV